MHFSFLEETNIPFPSYKLPTLSRSAITPQLQFLKKELFTSKNSFIFCDAKLIHTEKKKDLFLFLNSKKPQKSVIRKDDHKLFQSL